MRVSPLTTHRNQPGDIPGHLCQDEADSLPEDKHGPTAWSWRLQKDQGPASAHFIFFFPWGCLAWCLYIYIYMNVGIYTNAYGIYIFMLTVVGEKCWAVQNSLDRAAFHPSHTSYMLHQHRTMGGFLHTPQRQEDRKKHIFPGALPFLPS